MAEKYIFMSLGVVTFNYGHGWRIVKSGTGTLHVKHGGSEVGFRTYIFREIGNENTIILLSNISKKMDYFFRRLLDIVTYQLIDI